MHAHLVTGSPHDEGALRMRKVVAIILAACLAPLLVFTFAVSLATAQENTAPANADIKIALVMKTLTNPFFVAMEQGARRAEKELGITLQVVTAARETSATQQIAIIDKLVREHAVKAIVVAPADSIEIIPALKKAEDAGIRIVNIDNEIDRGFAAKAGLSELPFISIDNRKSAYLSAAYIAHDAGQPVEAAILEGIREARNANERKDGAVQAFAQNRNITLVASDTAHWQIDEAYDLAKKIFDQHPNISLLFCANDMMALGVIQYLQEINRRDVRIAAFDGIVEARAAIKDGWLMATIDQQPEQQGYLGVVYAYRSIKGEKLPAVTMLDGILVTK